MKKLLFVAFLMLFSPQLLMASPSQSGESEGVEIVRAIGDEVRKTGGALGDEVKAVSSAAVSEFDGIFTMAEGIIDKYGQSTVELGLTALRIQAWSNVIAPLVAIIVFSIVAYVAFRYAIPEKYSNAQLRQLYEDHGLRNALSRPYEQRAGTEDRLISKRLGLASSGVKPIKNDITYEDFSDLLSRSTPLSDKNRIAIAITGVSGFFMGSFLLLLLSDLWAIVGVFYPQVYGLHLMMVR